MVKVSLSSQGQLGPGIYGFSTGEAITYQSLWSIAGLFGVWCGHTDSWVSVVSQVQTVHAPLVVQLIYLNVCLGFLVSTPRPHWALFQTLAH